MSLSSSLRTSNLQSTPLSRPSSVPRLRSSVPAEGKLQSPRSTRPHSPYLLKGRLDFESGGRLGMRCPATISIPNYAPVYTSALVMSAPPSPRMQLVSAVPVHPIRLELPAGEPLTKLLCDELWAAQDAERRARAQLDLEMDLEKQKLILENQLLKDETRELKMQQQLAAKQQLEATVNEDINDLRSSRNAEHHEREELELRQKDVARSHWQLWNDFQQLQTVLTAEQQAHAKTHSLIGLVSSDVDRLREDLRKQREAHAEELNCSGRERDQKHRASEEATARVMRDIQKLQADCDAEGRACEFAMKKVKEIVKDVGRLQTDIENAEAAHDAEQREEEEVQRRRRDIEEKQRKLVEDYKKLDDACEKSKEDYELQFQSQHTPRYQPNGTTRRIEVITRRSPVSRAFSSIGASKAFENPHEVQTASCGVATASQRISPKRIVTPIQATTLPQRIAPIRIVTTSYPLAHPIPVHARNCEIHTDSGNSKLAMGTHGCEGGDGHTRLRRWGQTDGRQRY